MTRSRKSLETHEVERVLQDWLERNGDGGIKVWMEYGGQRSSFTIKSADVEDIRLLEDIEDA